MKEEHFVVTSGDAIRCGFLDRDSAIARAKRFRAERGIAASVTGPGYEISAAEIRKMVRKLP